MYIYPTEVWLSDSSHCHLAKSKSEIWRLSLNNPGGFQASTNSNYMDVDFVFKRPLLTVMCTNLFDVSRKGELNDSMSILTRHSDSMSCSIPFRISGSPCLYPWAIVGSIQSHHGRLQPRKLATTRSQRQYHRVILDPVF